MQPYSDATSIGERYGIREIDVVGRKDLQRLHELRAGLDLITWMVEQPSRYARNFVASRSIPFVQHPERFNEHDAPNADLAGSSDKRTCRRALSRIRRIIYERTQQHIGVNGNHL
jgi:hypothetical protein